MNTSRLLPIALATLRTNFLGPPAVRCELRDKRKKKCATKWGGLRGVDLPPLCTGKMGWKAPPIYQGTRRNRNCLCTEGETSVSDQVKLARSCQ